MRLIAKLKAKVILRVSTTKGEADIRSLPNIITGTKVPPKCLHGAPYTLLVLEDELLSSLHMQWSK